MTNLNDTVQQSDVVSIGGSCEQRCDPVSDLLCHTLRTHTVVLQEHLDTTYKPGANRWTTHGDAVAAIINIFLSGLLQAVYERCIFLTERC